MLQKPLFVRAEWDEDVRVWVATSDDVPGLATEEENLEALIEKLKILIPELLDANGIKRGYEVPFEILTRRFETAQQAEVNIYPSVGLEYIELLAADQRRQKLTL